MAAQEPKPDEEQQMGQEVFNELKAKGEIVESSPLYDKLQPIADAITPGWVVALPLYAIEIKLALASPSGAPADLSHASIQRRYEAIDEELETAASLAPVPPPGSTGEAAEYFQQPSTLFVDALSRSTADSCPPPVPSFVPQLATG